VIPVQITGKVASLHSFLSTLKSLVEVLKYGGQVLSGAPRRSAILISAPICSKEVEAACCCPRLTEARLRAGLCETSTKMDGAPKGLAFVLSQHSTFSKAILNTGREVQATAPPCPGWLFQSSVLSFFSLLFSTTDGVHFVREKAEGWRRLYVCFSCIIDG
jgi:hypothetical protein